MKDDMKMFPGDEEKGASTKGRRTRGRNRGKGKEMEVNVKDAMVNKADLPHVITSAHTNNDPSWYQNIPELANDVATLPFSLPSGLRTNPLPAVSNVAPGSTTYSSPAIMTVSLMPTIGYSDAPTSAANIAAQQFYTLVRKANSGAVNYGKTDLMMTLLAMDSAYMLYEHLVRIYRTLGTYNYMNRYMPDAVLSALGASSALGNSLADFRGILDLFAYQLASINIPDQFDIIHRHSWLFTNVYTDAKDIKAQMYAFVPHGLYVWTEGSASQPTYLKYVQMDDPSLAGPNGFTTLDQVRTAINTIMQPIMGSQDIGIMSGDMAKAFGDGAMIKIKAMENYEAIQPVYDPEVLLQISNAYKGFNTLDTTKLDITVDNSNLTSGPYIVQALAENGGTVPWAAEIKPMLNFIDTEVNPSNVMVSTRLIGFQDSTGSDVRAVTYGTEIVMEYAITYLRGNADGTSTVTTSHVLDNTVVLTETAGLPGAITTFETLTQFTKFDWAPALYLIYSPSSGTAQYIGNTIDLCNYTFIEYRNISDINDTAIMSEFAVKDYNYQI